MNDESELMLSLVSSFAQEESINISSNIRWGINRMMKEGTYTPSRVSYGYRREGTGLVVVEPEAKVVRRIFKRYVDGLGYSRIAKELNEDNVPTITGCEAWSSTSVGDIIRNDVYAGTLIGQRYYMTDTFPPVEKRNYGEKAKYLIYDNHPAIISKTIAEKAQSIRELKREKVKVPDVEQWGKHCFVRKIYCGYTQKPYRKSRNQFFMNEVIGKDDRRVYKSIYIDEVKFCFNKVVMKLKQNPAIIEEIVSEYRKLSKRRVNPSELKEIENEILNTKKQMHDLVVEQTLDPKPSAFYMGKRNNLVSLHAELLKRRQKLISFNDYYHEIANIQRIADRIHHLEISEGFDELLFKELVQRIEIYDKKVVVLLSECLRFGERRENLS